MNWWSVICKAPVDLRQAGYDLHATREAELQPELERIYEDLDNVLSHKINQKLSAKPKAKRLSAVIGPSGNVSAERRLYQEIKDLNVKWQERFNQSVYLKIAEMLTGEKDSQYMPPKFQKDFKKIRTYYKISMLKSVV